MSSSDDHALPVQSVNLFDLSIEELETRLELAHPVFHPDGYQCGTDCHSYSQCGVHTSPLPN